MAAATQREEDSAPARQGVRLLRRSTSNRMIAGVCGGLGRYLGIDATLIRIAWVLLVLGAGTGILLYLIAWLVIPPQRAWEDLGPPARPIRTDPAMILGAALVIIGGLVMLDRHLPPINALLWPLGLIGIGAVILLGGARRRNN
ncbi:MAG TPA: PspC domain-containing protein [Actinomycetota bacterium]|nr:PspC domain-containing protein [Actinomycetota bacterium]